MTDAARLHVFSPQPPPPQSEDDTPRVDIGLPVRDIVAVIGPLVARAGLYLLGESRTLVTVDDRAKILPMEPIRFCSWLEQFIETFKERRSGPQPVTMGADLAGKILHADEFLEYLPRLKGVAPVRMPVWRGEEVELLPRGYDVATGIYCSDTVQFQEAMGLKEAASVLDDVLCEFEFPDGRWTKSRSGAVQLAALFSVFCHHLVPAGAPRPMIAYTANQPGSGKTLLANIALAPVWGDPGSTDFPLNERGGIDVSELRKELATCALNRRPYLWLDDAPAKINCNALNRFVTSSRHRGRKMGGQEEFDEPACTHVFVTGNMLEVTADLMRRSLVCELFVSGEVGERKFKKTIDSVWLADEENRARMLAALWACVRAWAEAGAPMHPSPQPPGFASWAGLVGGIVSMMGADPLAVPDLPTSGDQEGAEIRKLLVELATGLMDGERAAFTVDQVVTRARELDLLSDLVGLQNDPPLKAYERKRLGRRLGPWRGRKLRDGKGRLFEFGARKQEKGTVYPISWG